VSSWQSPFRLKPEATIDEARSHISTLKPEALLD